MKPIIKEHIQKLFFNPVVVAIPFALITIFLLPRHFEKNAIKVTTVEPTDKKGWNTIQYYKDLNGDGVEEIISHFMNRIDQCAIKILQNQHEYKGQWNFNGFLPKASRNLCYSDVDNDGILDVFTLYQRADSVFLGGLSMTNGSKKLFDDIFIDRIKVVNNKTDFESKLYAHDLNNDSTDELIVSINAGFSELPRRIYAWDYVNNSFLKSDTVGFKMNTLRFCDLDGDGFNEIVVNTVSYENIEKGLGIPYNDYERWFVVLDHKLNFKYGPIKTGNESGGVRSLIFTQDGEIQLLAFDHGKDPTRWSKFYKFDIQQKKLLPYMNSNDSLPFRMIYEYGNADQLLLFSYYADSGVIVTHMPQNKNLSINRVKIKPHMSYKSVINLPGTDIKCLVFEDASAPLRMLRFYDPNSFEELVSYKMSNGGKINNISLYTDVNGQNLLVLQVDEDIFNLTFKQDNIYWLKNTLIYLLIYGFYFLLIWRILKIQQKILRKHYEREKLISELKLKSIRSQLDPHFTFNAVNAIASAIYKGDKEVANNYFSLFSKLLRSTMLYSDRMSRSLMEELEFTRQYLDIELFRFREKFEYKIDVDADVKMNYEVPRMIIQSFAESAVGNGLMHRHTEGLLNIHISSDQNTLRIVFEDNGVGIEESKRLNKEKAFKAVRIMDEFISVFNELNHTDISYEMKDIDSGVKYPGTRVVVFLPVVFKYKKS